MNNFNLAPRIDRSFDYLEKTSVVLGVALLVALNVIAAFQIFTRFVDLGVSTVWTEELARYLLVIMVFVGAPYAMRNDDNISIRPLFRLLPALAQKILIIFSNVMIIVFSLLVIYSVDQVMDRTLGVTLTTIHWLTVGEAQIVLAVMFALVILFAIEESILMWQSNDTPIKSNVSESEDDNEDVAVSGGEGGD